MCPFLVAARADFLYSRYCSFRSLSWKAYPAKFPALSSAAFFGLLQNTVSWIVFILYHLDYIKFVLQHNNRIATYYVLWYNIHINCNWFTDLFVGGDVYWQTRNKPAAGLQLLHLKFWEMAEAVRKASLLQVVRLHKLKSNTTNLAKDSAGLLLFYLISS